ncbi:MAG TPA: farnesyl diphosphate synthase [Oscillatoriaceae cyanobacterium]
MPSAAAFDLSAYWAAWRAAIDETLDRLCPASHPAVLWESMRYSLQAGGKRIRPLLTLATIEALGGEPKAALPAACAVEFVHTQSLIHDDLPAMDNDDLRRGKPTNHKVYGEAQAILAGDAMLALAFALLSHELAAAYGAERCLAAVRELAEATVDMVAGQVVDMASEGRDVTADQLDYIHRHKTGALIRASVRLGAILGAASPERAAALDRFAEALGLAFQIADDIQDATCSAEELGKTPGKDQAAGKATYVALYGLAAARERLAATTSSAIAAIAEWGPEAEPLRAIARFVGDSAA